MSKVIVPWDLITNFVTDAFIGYGIPAEDAKICTDVLLESDRRGIESHGCNRFKPIYLDRIKAGIQNPVTQFEVLKEKAREMLSLTDVLVDGKFIEERKSPDLIFRGSSNQRIIDVPKTLAQGEVVLWEHKE